MFVAQPMDLNVRVFSSTGRFVRTIGRNGSGPGEFRRIDHIDWTARGLFVQDQQIGNLNLFSAQGRFVRSWPAVRHAWGETFRAKPPEVQLADGRLYTVPGFYTPPGARIESIPLSLVDADGTYAKELVRLKVGDHAKTVRSGGIVSPMPMPDATHTLYDAIPAQSAILLVTRTVIDAKRSSYTVTKIRSSGDTVYSRTVAVPTVSVDPAARQRQIARQAKRLAEMRPQLPADGIRGLYEQAWGEIQRQSPVDRLVVGRDGTFWLRHGAFAADTATWVAWSSSGTIQGYAKLPAATRVEYVTATEIWAVETGEYDEQYVVRYRVQAQ